MPLVNIGGKSMQIPTDNVSGYERARMADPELAANYIAHTQIGDPIADILVEQLASLPRDESTQMLEAVMDDPDAAILRDAPPAVHDFLKDLESVPDWVDTSEFGPGVRLFHRDSTTAMAAMVAGALVEGFTTNIAKSFFISGRLRDQGVRRLKQNNRHLVEIMIPGGLEPHGDGWKLSVRIRVIHAQIRRLFSNSRDWDLEAWGLPLHSAHLGFAITVFSARLLKHMASLGVPMSEEERASFMAIWRYTGYMMGIPETILFRDEPEALRIYRIGLMCEPTCQMESIAMANSLVNSSPVIAGITDPAERRKLAKYVFRVSRALIGKQFADDLMYPRCAHRGRTGDVSPGEALPPLRQQALPEADARDQLHRLQRPARHIRGGRVAHHLQAARPRLRGGILALVTLGPRCLL